MPSAGYAARVDPPAVVRMLENFADAGFNALRVWGGGWWEEDFFYSACARLGILVWQEAM